MLISHKQNLHTHTTFVDGKSSPSETVETALSKGFDSIGFSEHSPMFYKPSNGMANEDIPIYHREINELKQKYADRINIFCGIEYDAYSNIDISHFDYAIGSLHYFKFEEEYVGFDRSADEVNRIIKTYFGGDGMKYAKKYFEALSELPTYGRFDIIGHFDLISKHCESRDFFDINSKQYISYATQAAEALVGRIPFFEVNTGAMARGYRTTPYPSIPILKELKRLGFGAVISSDCHDAARLDCGFEDARELLLMCGFQEKYILTEQGFVPVSL